MIIKFVAIVLSFVMWQALLLFQNYKISNCNDFSSKCSRPIQFYNLE